MSMTECAVERLAEEVVWGVLMWRYCSSSQVAPVQLKCGVNWAELCVKEEGMDQWLLDGKEGVIQGESG